MPHFQKQLGCQAFNTFMIKTFSLGKLLREEKKLKFLCFAVLTITKYRQINIYQYHSADETFPEKIQENSQKSLKGIYIQCKYLNTCMDFHVHQ